MASIIKSISIEGYKSIRQLQDFELGHVNILVGSNGAGKSNFIGFFRFLREMIDERLQITVQKGGGAAAYLHLGLKNTRSIAASLRFGSNRYDFRLAPTVEGRLIIEEEKTFYYGSMGTSERMLGSGNLEATVRSKKDDSGKSGSAHGVPYYVYQSVSDWIVYHFHDTSETAPVRLPGLVIDNEYLRSDAGNLAAFLYRLQETQPDSYARIVAVVRLAAPFFGDFRLRVNPINPDYIALEWQQKDSDYPFLPSQLSDGTLRFICLATALLQPSLPATILFDEPELGLHPFALVLLGRLLRGASQPWGTPTNQVIVSTQSALLLNEFTPDEVIIVERLEGQSAFRRLRSEDLSTWLEDYTLGELWQKNVFGGRPRAETSTIERAGLI
jgi:predicted ATPase